MWLFDWIGKFFELFFGGSGSHRVDRENRNEEKEIKDLEKKKKQEEKLQEKEEEKAKKGKNKIRKIGSGIKKAYSHASSGVRSKLSKAFDKLKEEDKIEEKIADGEDNIAKEKEDIKNITNINVQVNLNLKEAMAQAAQEGNPEVVKGISEAMIEDAEFEEIEQDQGKILLLEEGIHKKAKKDAEEILQHEIQEERVA